MTGLTLAIGGLGASGYFLLALGLCCAGLGVYLRKGGDAAPASSEPEKAKGKKNRKSKKAKKQSEAPKKEKAEGGSLIWGGLFFALLGVGMVAADLMR